MKIQHVLTMLVLTGATALPAVAQAADSAPSPARSDLAVLYVGSEDGERKADFVRFLGAHFETVGTAVYPTFEEAQADAYDVVVLDVQMRFTERSIGIGPQPDLAPTYSRATVLVNGPGVIVAERKLESKIDWL